MRITETIDYPAAPERVYAMMTDEAFLDAVCRATHAISHDASVTEHAGGATVVTTRDLPTDGFPDFVRSFVGETITVVQTVTYAEEGADGRRDGDLMITMGTAPIGLKGSISIAPSAAGADATTVVIDGELSSSVPFLGGKIEKAAEPSVRSAVRKEHETGLAWLAQ